MGPAVKAFDGPTRVEVRLDFAGTGGSLKASKPRGWQTLLLTGFSLREITRGQSEYTGMQTSRSALRRPRMLSSMVLRTLAA
jgi:hypothetical protein